MIQNEKVIIFFAFRNENLGYLKNWVRLKMYAK